MSEFRELRSVNLNLLPVLRALLRHASVTEAARALHLSQSSVSGSLKLLR
ncbi:MAG: LysR family transcriptional regulator, partial [Myxococcota bacterium]